MKKVILFCCSCLIAINFMGCEGPAGPTGPVGRSEYSVFGQVSFTSDTLPTYTYVVVSNISSIPTVKLNQDLSKFSNFGYQGASYWDTLRTITEGDEVQLTISGNQGIASAVVRIPQKFTIQSPDPDSLFILSPHSNFTVSWTASNFTDYYDTYFYLYYTYVPIGGGGSKYFEFYVDTILSTTSITIPASRLFPADFDSLSSGYSYGRFEIIAINGPRPEVGAQGNVTGDGFGFFFGRSDGGDIDIRVQNSAGTYSGTKLKSDFKHEQSEKFYKKFLKWQKMSD
ncbi:MAG: hypothetical protein WBQ32_12555 [Ignavibacteriaceae bacterium]